MDHRFGGQHQYVLFHFRLTYIYVNTSYFIVLLFDHELWFEKSWALQLQLVTNLNDKVAILVLLPAAKRLAIYLPCQSVDVLCDSYRSTAPLAQRKQINIPTTPPTHVLDVANVILRHAPHLRLCGHKSKIVSKQQNILLGHWKSCSSYIVVPRPSPPPVLIACSAWCGEGLPGNEATSSPGPFEATLYLDIASFLCCS